MHKYRKPLRYLPFVTLLAVMGCAEGTTVSECEENTFWCDGNNLMKCENGNKSVKEYCNAEQVCDETSSSCKAKGKEPDCTNDTWECQTNRLMQCQNGKWNLQIDCSAGQKICNAAAHTCDESGSSIAVCNNGQKACSNNAIMECENNAYTKLVQQCSSEQSCNSNTLKCDDQILIKCKDGAIKCAGKTPMVCSDNDWVAQSPCGANETCNSVTGTCDKVSCTSGAASCDSSNTLTYCDSNGQNQTRKCTGNTVCDAQSADCVDPDAGKCTVNGQKIDDGATICSGNNLITCHNGSTSTNSCGYGVCRENDTQCSEYKSCTIGSMTIAHNALACGEGGKSIVRCNDGNLETTSTCSGKTTCMPTGNEYTCDEPPAQSCSLNNETIGKGVYRCDNNILRLCTENGLTDGTNCASNNDGKSKCDKDKCVAASCTVGDTTVASGSTTCNADGTQKVKCEDGKLNTVSTGACTSSQICQIDGGTPVCVDKGKSYTKIADIWKDYNSIVDGSCASTANYVKPASVEITGVVTYLNSSGVIFIQDPSVSNAQHAGIMINCAGNGKGCNGIKGLSVGKQIKVTADGVGYSYCQLQVRGNSTESIQITQSGSGNITPYGIDAIHINSGASNLYNSSLVSLSNVTITGATSGGYGAQDTSGWFKISTDAYAPASLSGKINVTGIVKYINNESILMPRQASDITTIECSGNETKCTDNNKLSTCNNNKWSTATACTTSVANANPICKSNTCSFECKKDYYLKNGKCEKIETSKKDCTDFVNNKTVKHGSVGCSSASATATCDDGKWTNTETCSGPSNSTASCNTGECSWKCQDGYEIAGDSCVPKSCTGFGGTTIASGNKGCSNSNTFATCDKGSWKETQTCELGCDSSINACKSKDETAISWCIFNYLDEISDHVAFLQIAPQDVDYTPYFKCTTDPTKAVDKWPITINAAKNASFNCGYDCNNKEYMSAASDMPSDEGTYTCVAMIDVKDGYSYICPNDDNGAYTNVIRANDDIIPETSHTRSYTVSPVVANPIKWCKFAISYQNSPDRIAFIQFLPPDGMTANDVTAKTRCTTASDYGTKPISDWEFSVDTNTKNTSCSDCGSANTEYMTNKGDLSNAKGSHHCVGIVSVKGGSSFVCPTDPEKTPVLYDNTTKANEPHATEWGYTVN